MLAPCWPHAHVDRALHPQVWLILTAKVLALRVVKSNISEVVRQYEELEVSAQVELHKRKAERDEQAVDKVIKPSPRRRIKQVDGEAGGGQGGGGCGMMHLCACLAGVCWTGRGAGGGGAVELYTRWVGWETLSLPDYVPTTTTTDWSLLSLPDYVPTTTTANWSLLNWVCAGSTSRASTPAPTPARAGATGGAAGRGGEAEPWAEAGHAGLTGSRPSA